jgi:hypothetical protein
MKRGPKPRPVMPEPIGHITTPIEDEDLERVRAILKSHAVDMGEAGNWWLLFLPRETVKVRKEMRGKVPISTVRLPDGFCFIYEESLSARDGTYIIPPRVFIEEESADVQS